MRPSTHCKRRRSSRRAAARAVSRAWFVEIRSSVSSGRCRFVKPSPSAIAKVRGSWAKGPSSGPTAMPGMVARSCRMTTCSLLTGTARRWLTIPSAPLASTTTGWPATRTRMRQVAASWRSATSRGQRSRSQTRTAVMTWTPVCGIRLWAVDVGEPAAVLTVSLERIERRLRTALERARSRRGQLGGRRAGPCGHHAPEAVACPDASRDERFCSLPCTPPFEHFRCPYLHSGRESRSPSVGSPSGPHQPGRVCCFYAALGSSRSKCCF